MPGFFSQQQYGGSSYGKVLALCGISYFPLFSVGFCERKPKTPRENRRTTSEVRV